MAGGGEEGVVTASLSKVALAVHSAPGPALGAKDKAVSKAARNPAQRTHAEQGDLLQPITEITPWSLGAGGTPGRQGCWERA